MAFQVPESCLPALLEQLTVDLIHGRAIQMVGAIHNALNGKLKAIFYTDKWPEISAVACEMMKPRISDVADLLLYATSSESLLWLLTETNLITWGQKQYIRGVECKYGEYLLEKLKQPELTFIADFDLYYLPIGTKNEPRLCPSGYTLGKLQEHHAEFVASHWEYLHNWPNRVTYFRDCIQNYDTVAIFNEEDPDTPVSWCFHYPTTEHAHLFTLEDHRRKGLGTIAVAALCQSESYNFKDILPQITTITNGSPNSKIASKLGFIKSGFISMTLMVK